MKRSVRIAIACVVALAVLSGVAAAAPSAAPYAPPAKRDYSQPLQSVGGGASDFHIMRIEQLRGIPTGSSVGVVSGGSSTLGLFVESDLMSKGFVVRQIDIYSLLSPREKSLIDPADDFAFFGNLVANIGAGDKGGAAASLDKLLPNDKVELENQLAERYVTLYGNLKKLVSLLNVDYLVVVGPVFKEMSYMMRIYDLNRFDIVYSCMFAGDTKQWRNMIGFPQKSPSSSFGFKTDAEPAAFWEMAFSKFAVDRMKIGAPVPEAPAPVEAKPSKK
jgi:hypothetical protein